MPAVQVYDPAMCCATGVCGPSVDPQLVRFAADVEWLQGQGVPVERYNLAQQPQAFAASATVRAALAERGTKCLPLILVDGIEAFSGRYPERGEITARLAIPVPGATSAELGGAAGDGASDELPVIQPRRCC